MCAKSRKTGRGQSKEVAIYSKQPQEVRISLSSAGEEEEEREVDSSEHFPPDSIAGEYYMTNRYSSLTEMLEPLRNSVK